MMLSIRTWNNVVRCTELNKDLLQAIRLGLVFFYDMILYVAAVPAKIQADTAVDVFERGDTGRTAISLPDGV